MEQEIKYLLEDYKRRMKEAEEKIADLKQELEDISRDSLRRVPKELQINRLKLKMDYYNTFIIELEQIVHSNLD